MAGGLLHHRICDSDDRTNRDPTGCSDELCRLTSRRCDPGVPDAFASAVSFAKVKPSRWRWSFAVERKLSPSSDYGGRPGTTRCHLRPTGDRTDRRRRATGRPLTPREGLSSLPAPMLRWRQPSASHTHPGWKRGDPGDGPHPRPLSGARERGACPSGAYGDGSVGFRLGHSALEVDSSAPNQPRSPTGGPPNRRTAEERGRWQRVLAPPATTKGAPGPLRPPSPSSPRVASAPFPSALPAAGYPASATTAASARANAAAAPASRASTSVRHRSSSRSRAPSSSR